MAEVASIADELKALEVRLCEVQASISMLTLSLIFRMNRFRVGNDETGNVVVRTVGTPRNFDFEIKDHVDVGAAPGFEFDVATKLLVLVLLCSKLAESHACTAL